MSYLVLADTCFALLSGNPNVAQRWHTFEQSISISWFSMAELYGLAAESRSPAQNRNLVNELVALLEPRRARFNVAAAQVFGELKALVHTRRLQLTDAELMEASLAITLGATLVTTRPVDWAALPGIVVERWH